MDNFNVKKWLFENKVTDRSSYVTEEIETKLENTPFAITILDIDTDEGKKNFIFSTLGKKHKVDEIRSKNKIEVNDIDDLVNDKVDKEDVEILKSIISLKDKYKLTSSEMPKAYAKFVKKQGSEEQAFEPFYKNFIKKINTSDNIKRNYYSIIDQAGKLNMAPLEYLESLK